MLVSFNSVQKTIMFCGALVVFLSALFFAVLASSFSAATFAALFFLMLVPVITTALLVFFADTSQGGAGVLRASTCSAVVAYFLVGSGTALLWLLVANFTSRTGMLFLLEFIYIILLGGALLLLGVAVKSTGDKEGATLRRVQQVVSMESRLRALKQHVPDGSPEAAGIDKVVDEVRYFDKNTVSPYDTGILEKLLDLESLLMTRDEQPLADVNKPEALIDLTAQAAAGSLPPGQADQPDPTTPPPVTESPMELINDLQKLAVLRHQDSVRNKRGGF